MKHTKNYFLPLLAIATFLLSACDDFLEKDISDKKVQVICPQDGAELHSNLLYFAWNEQEGAEKYHVRIVSPAFKNIQKYVCDTLLTSYKMELKLPKGEYEWSVQAENFGYKSLINYLAFKITGDEE